MFIVQWRTDSNPRPTRSGLRSIPMSQVGQGSLSVPSDARGALGFYYWQMDLPIQNWATPISVHFVFIPYWSLLAICLLLPARWVYARIRRKGSFAGRGFTPLGVGPPASIVAKSTADGES
jgi:hypothetical protein